MLIVVAAWSSTPVQDLVGSGGDGCYGCTSAVDVSKTRKGRKNVNTLTNINNAFLERLQFKQ